MSMKNIVEQYLKSWATRFQMIVTAKGPRLTQLQRSGVGYSEGGLDCITVAVGQDQAGQAWSRL